MNDLSKRPRTLLDLSQRVVAEAQGFDTALREFLDNFYAQPTQRSAAISDRPEILGGVYDPYLAAVAEHLARVFDLPIPEWSDDHGQPLRLAFFAGGLESMKARLTVESPTAFRRRMIFISKNALDRPRMLQEESASF